MESMTIEALEWMMDSKHYLGNAHDSSGRRFWQVRFRTHSKRHTTLWRPTLVDAINEARAAVAAFEEEQKGNDERKI